MTLEANILQLLLARPCASASTSSRGQAVQATQATATNNRKKRRCCWWPLAIAGGRWWREASLVELEGELQKERERVADASARQVVTAEQLADTRDELRDTRAKLVDAGMHAALADVLRGEPAVEEAHAIAGSTCMILKVRVRNADELGAFLKRLFAIRGVVRTESFISIDTLIDRGPSALPATVPSEA